MVIESQFQICALRMAKDHEHFRTLLEQDVKPIEAFQANEEILSSKWCHPWRILEYSLYFSLCCVWAVMEEQSLRFMAFFVDAAFIAS